MAATTSRSPSSRFVVQIQRRQTLPGGHVALAVRPFLFQFRFEPRIGPALARQRERDARNAACNAPSPRANVSNRRISRVKAAISSPGTANDAVSANCS